MKCAWYRMALLGCVLPGLLQAQDLSIRIGDSQQTVGPITAYGNQDGGKKQPTWATVLDGGATIEVGGNAWKKVPLPGGYTVTEQTVLAFDFSCPVEGEIQGVGLDADNKWSGSSCIKLCGWQSVSTWVQDYLGLLPAGGSYHYEIPVGQYSQFLGTMQYLTFLDDDDAAAAGVIRVSNIHLYEAEPAPLPYDDVQWPTASQRLLEPFGPISDTTQADGVRFHRAIDIAADIGDPVMAMAEGEVYRVYHADDPSSPYPNGGNVVILRHAFDQPFPFHGMTHTRYYSLSMHLDSIAVDDPVVGGPYEVVPRGALLGTVGMTGAADEPQLHLECRIGQTGSYDYQVANPTSLSARYWGTPTDPHVNPLWLLPRAERDSFQVRLLQVAPLRVQVVAPIDEVDFDSISLRWGTQSFDIGFNERTGFNLDDMDQAWFTDYRIRMGVFDGDSEEYVFMLTVPGWKGCDEIVVRDAAGHEQVISAPVSEQQGEGYAADVFMDAGVELNNYHTLPATDIMGLSMERLTTEDLAVQQAVVVASADDANGRLLYPDGAPRYRVIFTNGGDSVDHGASLGEDGRERVRAFYTAGGSYTGSCAGMNIASLARSTTGVFTEYYQLWPGRVIYGDLLDATTGYFMEPGSPLAAYGDFGGDDYVADLRHNRGAYAWEADPAWPIGTEVLARYDRSDKPMHQQPALIAYKAAPTSGRLVVGGSHPEAINHGERRELMRAILGYALDGAASPVVKGELVPSVDRVMDTTWADATPAFARIGDRQLHHFTVTVPEGCQSLVVDLQSDDDADLDLFLRHGAPASRGAYDRQSVFPLGGENILITDPAPGIWYVAVACASGVDLQAADWGPAYVGDLQLLEGVSYTIRCDLDLGGVARR